MISRRNRAWPIIVEDALIFVAILVLWPAILGWEGTVFKVLQLIAVGCLVGILVRRFGRIRDRGDERRG